MKWSKYSDGAMFNLGALFGSGMMWVTADNPAARWATIFIFGTLCAWNSWAWIREQERRR